MSRRFVDALKSLEPKVVGEPPTRLKALRRVRMNNNAVSEQFIRTQHIFDKTTRIRDKPSLYGVMVKFI